MNWSLSSVHDDVSAYTERLTVMERHLFATAVVAFTNHVQWQSHGLQHGRVRKNALHQLRASISSLSGPSNEFSRHGGNKYSASDAIDRSQLFLKAMQEKRPRLSYSRS
jgi:L-lactate utilization protein LutB